MFEAKERGKGAHVVHFYFPSQRYPNLVHRLCKASGRLYTMGHLNTQPEGRPLGWGRKCQECKRIKENMDSNTPQPLVGVL